MYKIKKIVFALLILMLAFTHSLPGVGSASPCTAAACVYMPVVRGAGSVDQAVSFTIAEKGHYSVQGLFSNVWGSVTASSPAINVVVESRFYDKETHELVNVASASPLLTATLPGQLNPFKIENGIDTLDHPDTYDTVNVVSWQPMSGAEYLPVTVVYSQTNIYGLITAELLNDTGKTLSHVRGLAWSQEVFSYLDPDGPTMAPGETITMSFYVPHIAPVYDTRNIKIAVQGIAAEPVPAALPALPSFSLFPEGVLGGSR